MEKKDWQGVIQEAKNKYELEWPQEEEELEEDPAFRAMWAELGGDKIDKKMNKKPAEKAVKVEIPAEQSVSKQKKADVESV